MKADTSVAVASVVRRRRTSTSTDDFPEIYLSTFQVLCKLYLSTDVLKYKVLLPGSATNVSATICQYPDVSIGDRSDYNLNFSSELCKRVRYPSPHLTLVGGFGRPRI